MNKEERGRINRWCSTHGSVVLESRRRPVHSVPVQYQFADEHSNFIPDTRVEDTLIVEIPVNSLLNIEEFESRVMNRIRVEGTHYHGYLIRRLEQDSMEEAIRSRNPAARLAWEHYQTLLAIASSGT